MKSKTNRNKATKKQLVPFFGSYSTQKIQRNRKTLLLVNSFIVFNLVVVPLTVFVTNNAKKGIDAAPSGQIWHQGYEDGFTGWGGTNQGAVGTYQKNTSTNIVREGSKSGRYELRDGDINITADERSEVQTTVTNTGGQENATTWYKWSTYFASPFDTSKGFQAFSQFKGNGTGSPPLAFYAEGGKIRLVANVKFADGSYSYNNLLWSTTLQTDKWYDFKMRNVWSTDGTKGKVQLWVNGSAVTMTPSGSQINGCSGNTCTVKNMTASDGVYYKQGLYRSANYTSTSVIYHDGFTSASTEEGLGEATTPPTTGGGTTTPPTTGGGSTGGGTTTPPTTGGGSTGGGTTTPPTTTTQSAFNGVKSIPGTIETEDFDNGGEGVSYHDTDTVNNLGKYRTTGVDIETASDGGFNIGWVAPGEWAEYTVNATAGTYDVGVNVSGYGNGSLTLKLDGTSIGTLTPTSTNGWQTYQTAYIRNVTINTAGTRVLRMEMNGQPVNTSKITFTPVTVSPPSGGETTTPTTGGTNTNNQTGGGDNTVITPAKPLVDVIKLVDSSTGNVKVTQDIPTNSAGQLVADFNRDGLNDIASDINNDGFIDTNTEILVDGENNPSLTDTSVEANKLPGNVLSFSVGPFGRVTITEDNLKTIYVSQIALAIVATVIIFINYKTHFIGIIFSRLRGR